MNNGFEDHAADCACSECADVRLILALDGETEPIAPLPSSDFLWWKAQLQARREAVEKSTRPIALAERAGVAGAVVAAVLALSAVTWGGLAAGAVAGVLISVVPVAVWAVRAHHSE